jgi:murein DD-endopeptidase MepM/ murein hydrolase activator NlpD
LRSRDDGRTISGVMIAPSQALACPSCSTPVDVKSRYVAVVGSMVRIFCSQACLQGDVVAIPQATAIEPRRRRSRTLHTIGIALGGGLLLVSHDWTADGDAMPVEIAPPAIEHGAVHEVTREDEPRFEAAWTADLMNDAWFHPLAGPKRRMPHNHNQAFGAVRDGERPPECFSGHCGVDVGGGQWGEPVRAVHGGVVAHVDRGPNEDSGGIYVELSHREGTVFTQYFHLAAVPRWVATGARVEAGQVIGLIGDTGIKRSAPHLHFSIFVQPTKNAPKRYLDPEPLLAIWPLWLSDDPDCGVVTATTEAPPGLPARGRKPKRKATPAAAVEAPGPVSTP